MERSRRDICRPLIAKIIRLCGVQDLKVLRRTLREAYPWGERKYWPYKVWCSEVRRQREKAIWQARNPELAEIENRMLEAIEGSLFFGTQTQPPPQTFRGLLPEPRVGVESTPGGTE